MRLPPGHRLGTYEIVSLVGAGGMGEVYRARDSKLDRDVALKVLTASLAHDPSMVARFEREAKALAALSHPNVLGVFDYGREGDDWFVVTELLEGETLRDRLVQVSHGRQLPLAKALEWAAAVAQGLAAAHAKGLVHRDLKPENVFVTASGNLKILDFGLARLAEPAADPGPTRTPATAAGAVVGSAAYMSPEQVQGLPLDHRSDIFSFGTLLYELVTGRHPFRLGSPLQTMQRIVEAEPAAMSEVAPDVPAELEWVVSKALAKDPAERYQSSADMVVDLQRVRKQVDSGVVSTPARGYSSAARLRAARSARDRGWLVPAVVAALLLVIAAGVWLSREAFRPNDRSGGRLAIRPLTSNGLVIDAAISPDGKYVAYVESFEGLQSLWLKQVGTGSVLTLVPGAPVGYWGITFAPDGSSIYYGLRSADTGGAGAVFQVSTLGGTPRRLFNGTDSVVSFSPDGSKISYLRSDHPPGHSSVLVAAADGTGARVLASRQLPEAFAPGFFISTAWSRDGRIIHAPLRDQRGPSMRIVALDAETGAEVAFAFPRDRFLVIGSMTVLPDGAIAFIGSPTQGGGVTSGNEQVWLLPAGSSEPRPVTSDLSGYRAVHATADGRTLSAVAGNATVSVWELNSDGSDRRRIVSSRLGGISGLTATPGGRLFFRSNEGGKADIWSMSSDGTDRRQLTTQGVNSNPAATRDENYVVYLSTQGGEVNVWRMDADGGNQRQIETIGALVQAPAISPDGRWVVFSSLQGGRPDLWRVSIDGGEPQRLTRGGADKPAISPDGRWVAAIYFPDRDRNATAAILPIEGGEPVKTLPIAASTISTLQWAPDGSHLIHTAGGGRQTIYTQALDGSPAQPLVRYPEEQIFALEVLPDGRMIVVRGLLSRDAVMISDFR